MDPAPRETPGPDALVPTTSIPTTSIPTTSIPIISIPITSIPTTSVPTTSNPITSISITPVPTTSNPTTSVPTTSIPTTSNPITSISITPVPTTSIPTTSTPITPVPITSNPTTFISTTSLPTTPVPAAPIPTAGAGTPGSTFAEQARESREHGYLLSSRQIGAGAFSQVYLGYATPEKVRQNPRLAADLRAKRHRMVAIKVVSAATAPAGYCKKFLPREIASLNATYKHVNVIQLYETYRGRQHTYLVLELAPGGDLLEHVNATSDRRRRPGLEEEEARRLFHQIVGAVAHCHRVGVVHRDLKCENILLDERGFVKLTDFGFASRCSPRSGLMSTFCGSVAYTAPEILLSKKYKGELADLWSLGVILYAMVAGRLPFRERQPPEMVRAMKRGPCFQPAVSAGCRDLIQGLLQLRPGARLGLQQVAAHSWMLPAASSAGRPPGLGPTRPRSAAPSLAAAPNPPSGLPGPGRRPARPEVPPGSRAVPARDAFPGRAAAGRPAPCGRLFRLPAPRPAWLGLFQPGFRKPPPPAASGARRHRAGEAKGAAPRGASSGAAVALRSLCARRKHLPEAAVN
ncbi:testis-specific serine/threonine-protein kinase 5-like [Struthio camelus]|uniref:testis-specific serine/threonine-protein kinase 5-like n=1 Tax=Struthio camelus TaxID=8801 RepID=UPI0036042EFC